MDLSVRVSLGVSDSYSGPVDSLVEVGERSISNVAAVRNLSDEVDMPQIASQTFI